MLPHLSLNVPKYCPNYLLISSPIYSTISTITYYIIYVFSRTRKCQACETSQPHLISVELAILAGGRGITSMVWYGMILWLGLEACLLACEIVRLPQLSLGPGQNLLSRALGLQDIFHVFKHNHFSMAKKKFILSKSVWSKECSFQKLLVNNFWSWKSVGIINILVKIMR